MTVRADPLTLEERLRDIQAITDAALSHLDDRDFLAQLLARTRDILGTDTAALLLLDESSKQLIATAAAGLEEEVRQGVLIPVGRGFAGRIAAERRPVILDRVDHTTVMNPILWAKGIQSMMGVPLVAGGRVIGVLHVGSLDRREFTSQDTELLQMAADRAAVAMQSMMAATCQDGFITGHDFDRGPPLVRVRPDHHCAHAHLTRFPGHFPAREGNATSSCARTRPLPSSWPGVPASRIQLTRQ